MIKSYIFLVKNKISRNKRYFLLNTLLLFIMLTTVIINLSFSIFINNYTNESYEKNYAFRKIFVSYDIDIYSEKDVINKISQIPNIELALPQNNFFTPVDADIGSGDYLGTIYFIPCTKTTAPVTLNKSTIKNNTIIIPNKFMYNNEYINGNELIGKQINVKYDIKDYTPTINGKNIDYRSKTIGSKEVTYSVVGTYDSEEYFEQNNTCYILSDDLKNLKIDDIKYENKDSYSSIVVICDKYKNTQSVIKALNEKGFRSKLAGFINNKFTNLITISGFIISFILMLLSITTIWSTIKIDFHNNKTEYALFKCMGYKNNQLYNIMLIEQLSISLVSILLSVLVSLFTISRIRVFVENSIDSTGNCVMKISIIALLAGILLSIIIPTIILMINAKKMEKISPAEASK